MLPVKNPTTSYWQATSADSPIHDHGRDGALRSDDVLDVVIVGSGISGATAAYSLLIDEAGDEKHDRRVNGVQDSDEIKQREGVPERPKVALVEARQACSGATGRNGGHCRPDAYAGFLRYAAIVGKDQSHKILVNERQTMDYIRETAKRESIDCDWWQGKTFAVFMTEELKALSRKSYEAYDEYGKLNKEEVTWIEDASEAQRVTRIPGCIGAVTFPAGSVYPLRFVHGLLSRCLEAGLQLFTHTPVTKVEQEDKSGLWTVSTPRGQLRTKHVLLATNGYTEALVPDMHDFLLSHKAQCSSINPPSSFRDDGSLQHTYSIIKGGTDFEYLVQRPCSDADRSRKGGPFILGGGHPLAPRDQMVGTFDDSTVTEAVEEHLRTYPGKTFEGWKDDESHLTHMWSGIQGYTRDSLPLCGQHGAASLARGLWLCVGMQGHGMARAATCGRGVARLILAQLAGTLDENTTTDEQWEQISGLPSCFRWTKTRSKRRDVDCRYE